MKLHSMVRFFLLFKIIRQLKLFEKTALSGSNILVIGGNNDDSDDYGKRATVFNKMDNCQRLTDLPMPLRYSVGALIGQQPVLCSGFTYSEVNIDKCFKYENNQWDHFATLKTARHFAAGIVLDDEKLWMTGGEADGQALQSTEFVTMTGEVTQGYDLLEPLLGHCMLKTFENEQRVFIIGGDNGWMVGFGTTRIYVASQGSTYYLEDGPALNTPRLFHGCSVFTSANHENRDIAIVVGGFNGDELSSVEVWDFQTTGSTWMTSKWIRNVL